jgi:hypothetical protein
MRLCVFDCCLILCAMRALGTCNEVCFSLSGKVGFNRRAIGSKEGVCLVVELGSFLRNGC